MELTSHTTTSPGPEAPASVHRAFIKEAIPGWLAKARPQRLEELSAARAPLPQWTKDVSAADHLVLKRMMAANWSAQNAVDKMFADLKDPYAFAEPLLMEALSTQYGVRENVRETFLKLYSPASHSPWAYDFGKGATSRTISLLDAALHNFSSSQEYLSGSDFITRPDSWGRFHIKDTRQKITIAQFQALCRALDLGAKYAAYLDDYLNLSDGLAKGVLEYRVIASQKAALSVALELARVKGDVGVEAYRLVQGLINDQPQSANAVNYYHLSMMDTRLRGIVLIVPAHFDQRVIAYVPHDPEHPVKEYASSLELLNELTRQLRDRRYQQFFSRFVDHRQRGYFFADLNQRLTHVTWHLKAPGEDLPSWRETPVDHPRLHYGVVSFKDDNEHRYGGNVWRYLCQQQVNKFFNDARDVVVSTAESDRAARWASIDNLERMLGDIFNVALMVVAPFVPFFGELMLAYTAYQLTSEVVEGVVDLSEGQYLEASDHLLGVAQNLAQLAAFGAAGVIGGQFYARLSPMIEGSRQVTLADGQKRLWGQNLEPYQQQNLILPPDSKPNELWLHPHQGKSILRVDSRHFELVKDPQTAGHRVAHPGRADAYQPTVQSNGAGAFVIEGERPQEWDEHTLMARQGPLVEGLDESFDDMRVVSCSPVEALRRTYRNNEAPLPLLSDTATRFRIDQQVQTFIEQIGSDLPAHYLQADPLTQLQLLDGLLTGERRLQLIARDGTTVLWDSGSIAAAPTRIYEDRLINGDLLQTLLSHLDEAQTQHLMEQELGASVSTWEANARLLRAELARRASEQRMALFERRYTLSEAGWPAQVQSVRRQVPGLPGSVAQELLNVASAQELQALSEGRLPARLKGLAQVALDEVRVARAYEGIYLTSVEGFDTDKLVLHSLENLPGWPADIQLQVRRYDVEGRIMDSIGNQDAKLKRTIVALADGRFQVCDEQGQVLHAGTDFYASILQALPNDELKGLNIGRGETEQLKQAVRQHLLEREQLPAILDAHPAPVPPTIDPRLLRLRGGAAGDIPVEDTPEAVLRTQGRLRVRAGIAYDEAGQVSTDTFDQGLRVIDAQYSLRGLVTLEWAFFHARESPLATARLRQSVESLPELNKLLTPEQFSSLLDNAFNEQQWELSAAQRELAMTARYLNQTGRAAEYHALAQLATAEGASLDTAADLFSYARVFEWPAQPGKVIEVSAPTLANLQLAQRTITRSKELLPLSGNQRPSIWEKGGSAIAKLKNLRKIDLETGLPTADLTIAEAAQAAIKIMGGNCSENSKVTFSILASQPRTAAVHIVRASDFDHQYVLIGDLSKPAELVVADSWPELPAAHLAQEGYFNFDPDPVISLEPGPAVAEYSFIHDTPPGPPAIPARGSDDSTLRAIKVAKLHQKGSYAQWTSLKALGATYREPGGRPVSFERYGAELIERRVKAHEEYEHVIGPV